MQIHYHPKKGQEGEKKTYVGGEHTGRKRTGNSMPVERKGEGEGRQYVLTGTYKKKGLSLEQKTKSEFNKKRASTLLAHKGIKIWSVLSGGDKNKANTPTETFIPGGTGPTRTLSLDAKIQVGGFQLSGGLRKKNTNSTKRKKELQLSTHRSNNPKGEK